MTYILIPAKPFAQAKTRLSPVLSAEQRAALSRFLLRRTIAVARAVGPVVVVSRDAAVRRAAKEAGAWAIVEGQGGLNAAIRQGIAWVVARGAETALILPTDLPHLTLSSLQTMVALSGTQKPAVVIAPCRRERGTNALLLRPPVAIPPSFGADSFRRHCQAARRLGLSPIVCRHPALTFDLDTPDDWRQSGLKIFDHAFDLQYNRTTPISGEETVEGWESGIPDNQARTGRNGAPADC